MTNKHRRRGHRVADTPFNLTDGERAALITYVREVLDREHDRIGPSQLARVKRLKRLLAKLDGAPSGCLGRI